MAYVSPPIVEAVFDIQFADNLPESEIRRVALSLVPTHARAEDQFELSIAMGPTGAQPGQRFMGMRLVDPQAAYMVIVNERELATIKLAPYSHWEEFEKHAWHTYIGFKKTVGVRRITRTALRYVNRLDVPGSVTDFSPFVKLGVSLPVSLTNQKYQLLSNAEYKDFGVTLTCGHATSPLVNFSAFLLDIDVFATSDLPQRDEDLRALFSEMRLVKNAIFEDIVTDESRRLFAGGMNV